MTALRRDGARLADAATDLARPVPSCPGWNVGELLWHTGEVLNRWSLIAVGEAHPEHYELPPRPPAAELVAWFRAIVEAAASRLERVDPQRPAWTWSSQHDAGFIQRRMAHEVAVHCWDALAAAGRDEPVERELAADGIDEFLAFFLPEAPPPALTADVHLHTTDGDGEWLVTPADGGWRITREHRKAAVAIRATASDLLLLLWGRKHAGVAQTFGDAAALPLFLTGPAVD
ncbi:maleylpyruvate isomerase family mycothiol-dependent enzyme [Amycolatopsis acididurans]|nr:maleylpyruvate isomerase family mycothiol-dependent enzyme [Amycolatopsis acididurans]